VDKRRKDVADDDVVCNGCAQIEEDGANRDDNDARLSKGRLGHSLVRPSLRDLAEKTTEIEGKEVGRERDPGSVDVEISKAMSHKRVAPRSVGDTPLRTS
jgi:hypothetical protein